MPGPSLHLQHVTYMLSNVHSLIQYTLFRAFYMPGTEGTETKQITSLPLGRLLPGGEADSKETKYMVCQVRIDATEKNKGRSRRCHSDWGLLFYSVQ